MNAPLPPRFANLLANANDTNPGLLFDRGIDPNGLLYDSQGIVGKEGAKGKFLTAFCEKYAQRNAVPQELFLAREVRRTHALKAVGAFRVERKTTARLVIGLGLPQPVDTGFLFDRLTGVPYLPGSSIKGLLRQTARLVVAGELEEASAEDRAFWAAEATTIFGPAIEAGVTPQKGKLVVYEAFPTKWPTLAVEVLTPHHARWFGDGEPPGDWEDPTPVPFLAVEAGERFVFGFRLLGYEEDRETVNARIERLLDLGLDWLGVGGKRTSGYGVFGRNGGVKISGESRTPKAVQPAAPPTLEDLTALVKGLGLNNAGDRVEDILNRFAADPKPAARKIVETLGKSWKDAKHRDKPWAVRLREILQS